MRADLRRLVAAGLFLMLALSAPMAAHADDAAPAEPEPVQATAEPTPEATEPTPAPSESTPTPDPTPAPSEPTPTPTSSPKDSSSVTLTNAQFRWSVNALLHKTPFYGKNFLSAALLPDTQGQDMPAAQWKQTEGAVRIERASGGTYVPATWAGFGAGADHQVVIDGGTGTVDAAAGTAHISWRGSFGIARYSGQTGFSVTDPALIVASGVGRIEATLSGFQVSREGNGSGNAGGPIGPTTVVLADLGQVDLTNSAGLTKAPTFYGVRSGHTAQKQDSQGRWGSFPVSLISFVDQVGQAPFWMTSGLDDDAKPGSPVAVSFNAAAPIIVKPPATTETKKPDVSNPTTKAPPSKTASAPQPVPLTAEPRVSPVVNAPPSTSVPVSVAFTNAASLTAAEPSVLTDPDGESSDLGWWIAATFLVMAAAAVAAPTLLVRPRTA